MIKPWAIVDLSSYGNFELNKKVVIDKLMVNCIIRPHLPTYYLPPNETKAQHAFIQGLKAKFQEVKRM
jgi:hypothetical protein